MTLVTYLVLLLIQMLQTIALHPYIQARLVSKKSSDWFSGKDQFTWGHCHVHAWGKSVCCTVHGIGHVRMGVGNKAPKHSNLISFFKLLMVDSPWICLVWDSLGPVLHIICCYNIEVKRFQQALAQTSQL